MLKSISQKPIMELVPLLVLLLLCHLTLFSFSQKENSILQTKPKVYQHNHIGFSIAPTLFNKGKINGEREPNNPYSTAQLGIEGGFDYFINYNKFAIVTGFHFGISPRNFGFNIPLANLNSPPLNLQYTDGGNYFNLSELMYFSIPILLEKKWTTGNKFYFFNAGFSAKLAAIFSVNNTSVTYSNIGYSAKILAVREDWKDASKPKIDIGFAGGYGITLKNKNILRITITTSIATQPFMEGTYKFTVPNQLVQEGTYETNGSYIGLSIGYVLTGSNTRFVRSLTSKQRK